MDTLNAAPWTSLSSSSADTTELPRHPLRPSLRRVLDKLPGILAEELHRSGAKRTLYPRGTTLRGLFSRPGGNHVHVILDGCVSERTLYGFSDTLRFRGRGEVLGDVEIFSDVQPATAVCLAPTRTWAIPLERMRALAELHPLIMIAMGKSIADRLQRTERVYGTPSRDVDERVSGLLIDLGQTSGQHYTDGTIKVAGPSQIDLAEALCLSRASVEKAVRRLRQADLIETGYRSYELRDLHALQRIAEGSRREWKAA